MSPPPLSWGRLVLLVLRTGMLWLAEAAGGAVARSSSESLLLELPSLLEDDELFDELSLLIWSMTCASAINSAHEKQTCHMRRSSSHDVIQPLNHNETWKLMKVDLKMSCWLPRSMSSMGDAGDVFSLGGELLELAELLLVPLPPLLLLVFVFTWWPMRLVCCSMREWILLLPSALENPKSMNKLNGL